MARDVPGGVGMGGCVGSGASLRSSADPRRVLFPIGSSGVAFSAC